MSLYQVENNPSRTISDGPAVKRMTRILAWLTLMLGAITVVGCIYIGIYGYSPVLFGDEWTMPMDTLMLGGHYPLSKLWEQHNEHRIPFQKLMEMLNIYWFQDDQRFPILLNLVVLASMCAVGAFFLKQLSGITPVERWTAIGLLLFCAFNPASMQIFVWGVGMTLLASFVSVFSSLGALTLYSIRVRGGQPARGWLFLALAMAFVAEASFASGALVWVVLPFCGFLLGLRFRTIAAIAATGTIAIGIYLIGYTTPGNASNPLDAAKNISLVLVFVEAHLGQTWHDVWPGAGDSLAIAALAGFVIYTAVLLLTAKHKREPLQVFGWSLGALMLLTSLVMALGRQNEGVAQAREGRYQVGAVLFWYAVALILISSTGKLGRWRSPTLIGLQVLFCVVMAKNLTAFPALAKTWASDSYTKNIAGLSVELGVNDLPNIRHIYPDPTIVIQAYRSMTSVGLVKPPFPEIELIGRHLDKAFPIHESGCSGSIQTVKVVFDGPLVRDISAEGSFLASRGDQKIKRVFAVSDGLIAGFGVANEDHWHLAATIPNTIRDFSVYALAPDGNGVCFPPLTGPMPDRP